MTWIVDTCVVIDVLEADPLFGESSARSLQTLLPEGLAVCPVTMVELAAAFDGNLAEQKRFLDLCGISWRETWTSRDTESSHQAWNEYVRSRRKHRLPKRPVADLLIGGFAANRKGLVTRNPGDFQRWFPDLAMVNPA